MARLEKEEGHALLPAFAKKSGKCNFVIETPRGCRNKYKYDDHFGLFRLHAILPNGASFPFDFGYIPQTLGDDGDPTDVLVLMDEQAFPGCVVEGRLIGVIEAEQTEKNGKSARNDRIIGVCAKSVEYQDVKSLKDLPERVLAQIEHFFISYNEMRGTKFKPLARRGPSPALREVKRTAKAYGKARA